MKRTFYNEGLYDWLVVVYTVCGTAGSLNFNIIVIITGLVVSSGAQLTPRSSSPVPSVSAGHSRKPGIDAEKLSFYCRVCFNNFHSRSKFSFKTNICFIKVYFCFRMLKAFSLLSHSKPETEGKQIKVNICPAESAGNTEEDNLLILNKI